MKIFSFFFLCFFFASCSQTSYKARHYWEQGIGQWALYWQSRSLDNALDDPSVDKTAKEKIKLIVKAKKFFADFFSLSLSKNYQTVVFLEDKAVSYLVIASQAYEISPLIHSFPFVGSFPYLGFFKKQSAEEFKRNLEEQGFQTWSRPVYAYSTLGFFKDPVLSSMFNYSDRRLVEVIFEELFHELFFIKQDVDFSENIANFFAEELTNKFYKKSEASNQAYRTLNTFLVGSAKILAARYRGDKGCQKNSPQTCKEILKNFLESKFYPELRKKCKVFANIKQCYPLSLEWNNATFSAFSTYEKLREDIAHFYRKENIELLDFYQILLRSKKDYDAKVQKSFWKHFLKTGS